VQADCDVLLDHYGVYVRGTERLRITLRRFMATLISTIWWRIHRAGAEQVVREPHRSPAT